MMTPTAPSCLIRAQTRERRGTGGKKSPISWWAAPHWHGDEDQQGARKASTPSAPGCQKRDQKRGSWAEELEANQSTVGRPPR